MDTAGFPDVSIISGILSRISLLYIFIYLFLSFIIYQLWFQLSYFTTYMYIILNLLPYSCHIRGKTGILYNQIKFIYLYYNPTNRYTLYNFYKFYTFYQLAKRQTFKAERPRAAYLLQPQAFSMLYLFSLYLITLSAVL